MSSVCDADEFCRSRRSMSGARSPALSRTTPAPAAVDLLPDRRRLALRLALVAGVLAALGVAVASLPGLDEVRHRLAGAPPVWRAAALALQAASCLAFVAAFRGVFCRRLPWRLTYAVAM